MQFLLWHVVLFVMCCFSLVQKILGYPRPGDQNYSIFLAILKVAHPKILSGIY